MSQEESSVRFESAMESSDADASSVPLAQLQTVPSQAYAVLSGADEDASSIQSLTSYKKPTYRYIETDEQYSLMGVVVVAFFQNQIVKLDSIETLLSELSSVAARNPGHSMILDLSVVHFLPSTVFDRIRVLKSTIEARGGLLRCCALNTEVVVSNCSQSMGPDSMDSSRDVSLAVCQRHQCMAAKQATA